MILRGTPATQKGRKALGAARRRDRMTTRRPTSIEPRPSLRATRIACRVASEHANSLPSLGRVREYSRVKTGDLVRRTKVSSQMGKKNPSAQAVSSWTPRLPAISIEIEWASRTMDWSSRRRRPKTRTLGHASGRSWSPFEHPRAMMLSGGLSNTGASTRGLLDDAADAALMGP